MNHINVVRAQTRNSLAITWLTNRSLVNNSLINSALAKHSFTNSSRINTGGFSLINLIVTIAITLVLASVAIPSFAGLLSRSVIEHSATNLQHSLTLARQYAITHNTTVQVCRMADDNRKQCHQKRDFNASWNQGWLVFSDTNKNNELDSADKILSVTQNNTKSSVVFNQRGRLRFFANGSARSAGFYICDRNQKNYRHVVLLHTGRTRTTDSLGLRQRTICNNNSM